MSAAEPAPREEYEDAAALIESLLEREQRRLEIIKDLSRRVEAMCKTLEGARA